MKKITFFILCMLAIHVETVFSYSREGLSCDAPQSRCDDIAGNPQVTPCDEACFYLQACGITKLDRDKDGIPCEEFSCWPQLVPIPDSIKGMPKNIIEMTEVRFKQQYEIDWSNASMRCYSYSNYKPEFEQQRQSSISQPTPTPIPRKCQMTMPPPATIENDCKFVRMVNADTLVLSCKTEYKDEYLSKEYKLAGIDLLSSKHLSQAAVGITKNLQTTIEQQLKGKKVITEIVAPLSDTISGFLKFSGYIWLVEEKKMLNVQLIESGLALARAESHLCLNQFNEAQKKAQQAKKGIWSVADANGEKGICNIKGVLSRSGTTKYYLLPTQKIYKDFTVDVANGGSWFCSENEAVAWGWENLSD